MSLKKVARLLFSLELIWFRSLSSCVLCVSFLWVHWLKSSMNWTQQTSIAQCLYNIYFVFFLPFFFCLHCSLLGCNISGNSFTESAKLEVCYKQLWRLELLSAGTGLHCHVGINLEHDVLVFIKEQNAERRHLFWDATWFRNAGYHTHSTYDALDGGMVGWLQWLKKMKAMIY